MIGVACRPAASTKLNRHPLPCTTATSAGTIEEKIVEFVQRQVEVPGEGQEEGMELEAVGVKQEAGETQGQGLLASAAAGGTSAEGGTAGEAGPRQIAGFA
jgi:hypothetical protein